MMGMVGKILCAVVIGLCGLQCANVSTESEYPKPEYPLYGAVFGGKAEVTSGDLKAIAENFNFVYGQEFSPADMAATKQINPDIKFIKYVGIWTSDGYDSETRLKRGILYYQTAVLSENISPTAREFTLKSAQDGQAVELVASTAEGDISAYQSTETTSTQNYVTWIRIGDELMKIEAFDAATGRITVTRDFDGQGVSMHTAGEPVLCPEYGIAPAKSDWRGSTQLKYHYDPASTARWDRALELLYEFTENGGDGLWIDILGAKSLNEKTITGEGLYDDAWNFETGKPYLRDEFRAKNEAGVTYIQEKFSQRYGRMPIIYGNNLMATRYEVGEAGLRNLLVPTDVKPRAVDGMCIEDFAGGYDKEQWGRWYENREVSKPGKANDAGSYKNWKLNVELVMKASQDGLAAIPLIINAGMKTAIFEALSPADRHEWERWAYAMYLMGVERKDGKCTTMLGTPLFWKDGHEPSDRNARYVSLDECYYWPVGDPAETRKPDDLDGYRKAGGLTYARNFTNGIVLANPDETREEVYTLDRAYYDPDTKETVSEITMTAQTGKILLIVP